MKQSGYVDEAMLIVGGIFLLFLVFAVPVFLDAYSCKQRAAMMGLESRYGLLTGCMVKVQARWAPLGFIRIVDDKVVIQGDGE